MPAYKDKEKGTWYISFYCENWKGKRERKLKRGFRTKKEALEWEMEFKKQKSANLDMTFGSFIVIYTRDKIPSLKKNTWQTKKYIIENKLLPVFENKKMNEIKASDIIQWQNDMKSYRDKNNNQYSPTYLKTLHNQLSAIFNHAVKFYELKSNPVAKAGNMGKAKGKEMLFWTKSDYMKFSNSMMDKPISFYSFEMLYWCGIRLGELLALTKKDFDFNNGTVSINKSYQRLEREDIITDPKTPKSNRIIKMPNFLYEEMQDYLKTLYGYKINDRIFQITKSYLHHEMDRGSKEQDIKHIRIHDLRHSHISLLIDMGFSVVAIADRVGHEIIEITYQYSHLFPSKQIEIASKLDIKRTELEE